jgi:hypothetical protein
VVHMTTTQTSGQHFVVLTKSRLDTPGDPAAELRIIPCATKQSAKDTARHLYNCGRTGPAVIQAASADEAKQAYLRSHAGRWAMVCEQRETGEWA